MTSSKGPVRHIVLCRFRSEVAASSRLAFFEQIRRLAEIPGIAFTNFQCGPNVSPEGYGLDFADGFMMDFESRDACFAYLAHPTIARSARGSSKRWKAALTDCSSSISLWTIMRNLKGRLDLCSINTATLGHREPLSLTIDRIARAGFGGIAPWRHEVEKADVAQIAKQIKALDLTVTGYCRSTYLPAATRAQFVANIDENKAALRDAATLGARCFVMVVGGLPEGSRDLNGARAQVMRRHCGVA